MDKHEDVFKPPCRRQNCHGVDDGGVLLEAVARRAEGWTPSANLRRVRIDGMASIFRGLHHGSVLGTTERGKGFGNLGEGQDGREPSRFRNTCEAFKSVPSAAAPLVATVGIRPCELGLWASRS